MTSSRRSLLQGSLTVAGTAAIAGVTFNNGRPHLRDRRRPQSRVGILNHQAYDQRVEPELRKILSEFRLTIKGKRVLLKPNLVEVQRGMEINTRPELVGAAIDAFLALGAAEVLVAEGPGHQRDTMLVRIESGLEAELEPRGIRFVDFNRDQVVEVRNRGGYTGLSSLYLPEKLLAADLVVSMPKVKTHHWVGVTLAMKNMFGTLPGSVYGWPKNVLHWQGIHEAILDVCATVPPDLVIADGIFAMEGNGPLHGSPRALGKIVVSDDAVAADFTCCRLMGLLPERVKYLGEAARFLGNGDERKIEQLGEQIAPATPFGVVPEFAAILPAP